MNEFAKSMEDRDDYIKNYYDHYQRFYGAKKPLAIPDDTVNQATAGGTHS